MAQVSTNRLLNTGIFDLPDGASVDQVKTVYLNGVELAADQYAFTENGSIDVFEATENSVVTVDLKDAK